ncbi:MAG TPA: hypothetical protein VMN60_04575 [Longimicrobiales bacterium]|nr:hypothetical protein [Longimicrobiales bacterium]
MSAAEPTDPRGREDAPVPGPDSADLTRGPPPDGPESARRPARDPSAERSVSRAIVRAELRAVIRRAAELSLDDAAADEQLSEEEVLRIAAELGLPSHHVRRALYELPQLHAAPRWYDRYFGPPVFSLGRTIPDASPATLRRIEDYLVTREYLQLVRRQSGTLAFIPADDTLSSLARALFRPGRRHIIARASRVVVDVHHMPDQHAHVRFDVDLSDARREAMNSGAIAGTVLGTMSGAGVAALTVLILPESAGAVPVVMAFGGGLLATVAAGIAVAAQGFRNRVLAARLELDHLLDRIESGGRLDPPAPPWRRKLQLRLFGDRN